MHDWKSIKLTEDYLEGVRGGIPLAETQIELILRIIKTRIPDVSSFLDLGCGDGILGRNLWQEWPKAYGIFMDFSEPMLDVAKEKCNPRKGQCSLIFQDYSNPNWIQSIKDKTPLDVVISGYSIHHHDDTQKQMIYQKIYEILKPGGIFLNLEHVASPNKIVEGFFDDIFVDSLFSYQKKSGKSITRKEVADKYYNREDKVLNKLTMVDIQTKWLTDIGFVNVDCFFKLFELALFGGQKSE